jgi:hypothetical protein
LVYPKFTLIGTAEPFGKDFDAATRIADADGTGTTVLVPGALERADPAGDPDAVRPHLHSPAPWRSQRLGLVVQLVYLRHPSRVFPPDEAPFPPLLGIVAAQLKVTPAPGMTGL